jgi:SAM-dependent methyltransferase
MINRLHARLHRPEQGWDPVSPAHVRAYAEHEWAMLDEALIDRIEARTGSLAGMRILDLGAGPGHYAAAFARRGARVTWHDVSLGYRAYAMVRLEALGLTDRVAFSLGYLDDAARLLPEPFDLVFNRLCWNYAFDDARFASVVYRLARPGGWIYVDTHHSGYGRESVSLRVLARTWLNDRLGLKIGHPYPPRGRVARLLQRYPLWQLHADYLTLANDRILLQTAPRA